MMVKVVQRRSLPVALPIFDSITMWLLLDRIGAHGWPVGVIWTVWILFCAAIVYRAFSEEPYPPVLGNREN